MRNVSRLLLFILSDLLSELHLLNNGARINYLQEVIRVELLNLIFLSALTLYAEHESDPASLMDEATLIYTRLV